MSSGLSSDQIVKYEIIDNVKSYENIVLRIFPEGSNQDQSLIDEGGLTFTYGGVDYGSCDAVWFVKNGDKLIPVIGLEGTDALNRGSAGSAQYQRFHHALGAVKNGVIGVYYLRKGKNAIQLDLLEMAYSATKLEQNGGSYLIIQDLSVLNDLLELISKHGYNSMELRSYIENYCKSMHERWIFEKLSQYDYDMEIFAEKRSSIIFDKYIIKYTGRMKRNFTDSSQRAGHIAVGEMYLTKYLFPGRKIMYLCPRMTQSDVDYLDTHKAEDKEWILLRKEKDVFFKTRDDLLGLSNDIVQTLKEIETMPLVSGSESKYKFDECIKKIVTGLKDGTITLKV